MYHAKNGLVLLITLLARLGDKEVQYVRVRARVLNGTMGMFSAKVVE